MIRRPPRSTPLYSSAASDVYKRQVCRLCTVVVRQAALVSDKTKRVRGDYARRAIQIDDLYLYLYLLP